MGKRDSKKHGRLNDGTERERETERESVQLATQWVKLRQRGMGGEQIAWTYGGGAEFLISTIGYQ